MTYHEHVLPNGLRIAAEIDPHASSAAAGFFVKSGARDDPTEFMGISHFLEHMVFKGTETRSGEEVDQAFDDLGTRHNAWTSHDMTAYHVHGLPEVLDPSVRILADIMRPALRDDDLADERNVILEEIAMYEDQPFWQVWEATAEAYYGSHPMGHRVLGTNDTVGAIDPESMRAWHDQRYGADNMVLALAGHLNFDATVSLVETCCGDWPSRQATRADHAVTVVDDRISMRSDRVGSAYLVSVAPAPAIQDPDRHAAALTAWILGQGENSRLHWALIEPGRAEEAACEYEGHDGVGHYAAWAICPTDDADAVLETLVAQHDGVIDSIEAPDLDRAVALTRTLVSMAGELPAGRMQRLGRLLTTTGTRVSLEEELDRIEAITIDDLHDVATRWPVTPAVLGRLSPAG